jgi:zinc transporter ZupT
MQVVIMKIIAIVVLLIVGGTFAFIPYWAVKYVLKKEEEAERILSLGSSLAGGIFLGGGFVHLLPEAISLFASTEIEWGIPMAELLCVTGFLTVFMIEKVIFLRDEEHGHNHSKIQKTPETPQIEGKENEQENGKEETQDSAITIELESPPSTRFSDAKLLPSDSSTNLTEGVVLEEVDLEAKEGENEVKAAAKKGHDHSHFDPKGPLPYLMMAVLSIHSIIAGFALGVQSHIDYVYAIFFAILAHKWVESFALGVSLVRNGVPRNAFMKCILFYSLMVPGGIVVGVILSYVVTGKASDIIQAIVGGLASGTFIYIALVDVLLVEFQTAKDKWWKYVLAIFGFVVITLSVLLFDED